MAGIDQANVTNLHFDGTNGSTTFTDSSYAGGGSPHTFTAMGNAQLSTAQAKFGPSSLLCDGTGDGISTPTSTDYAVPTGPFSVDWWFNRQGGDGTQRFFFATSNAGASGGFSLLGDMTTGNQVRIRFSSDGSVVSGNVLTSTSTFTATGFNHAAVTKDSLNNWRLFINGVQEATFADGSAVFSSTDPFYVGAIGSGASLGWNGYIDEFRFTKGFARWTSNFGVPTVAYSLDDPYAPVQQAGPIQAQLRALGRALSGWRKQRGILVPA